MKVKKYTGFIALLLLMHCYSFSQVYEYKFYDSPVLVNVTNPFNDHIRLEFSESKHRKSVTLYDISGRIISSHTTRNKSLTINTDKLKRGIYIIRINTTESGFTEKLVKE